MTVKDKLLALFEAKKGTYFSGQELARELGVSRAAIWKAVSALRDSGYALDAVTNRGYCLRADTDILSSQGLEKYLTCPVRTEVFHQVDSTNALVRQRAAQGEAEGYIALADSQSSGRGRYGRSFYSPKDSGVYLSILLRPRQYTAAQAVKLTTMAAAAMCRAICQVSDLKPGIKWVNDIFLEGKKVCGILTEGAFSMESGMLEYGVLGVGINVYRPREGFPGELEGIAGALFRDSVPDMKNRLTAAFLNHFWEYYSRGGDFLDIYRKFSLAPGKQVKVVSREGERSARALAIDDDCRLLVRYDSGETEALSYGEIRITI